MPNTDPLTFKKIPLTHTGSELLGSKAWQEMVEIVGRVCQLLNLPRSTGQIFGLLFFSTEALTLREISVMLGISKASVSTGTRQLAAWGAIRKVWVPGDRKDYYEAAGDITQIIRGSYYNLVKPRLDSSKDRLRHLKESLESDMQSGRLPKEKEEMIRARISSLEKMQRRILKLLPLAEKFLK